VHRSVEASITALTGVHRLLSHPLSPLGEAAWAYISTVLVSTDLCSLTLSPFCRVEAIIWLMNSASVAGQPGDVQYVTCTLLRRTPYCSPTQVRSTTGTGFQDKCALV
jgi:hypothetical protein